MWNHKKKTPNQTTNKPTIKCFPCYTPPWFFDKFTLLYYFYLKVKTIAEADICKSKIRLGWSKSVAAISFVEEWACWNIQQCMVMSTFHLVLLVQSQWQRQVRVCSFSQKTPSESVFSDSESPLAMWNHNFLFLLNIDLSTLWQMNHTYLIACRTFCLFFALLQQIPHLCFCVILSSPAYTECNGTVIEI